MIIPRFSVKFLLILITGFGLLSLIFAAAAQSKHWGVAMTLAIILVMVAPVFSFLFYLFVHVLSLIGKSLVIPPRAGSPFEGANASAVQQANARPPSQDNSEKT